MRFPFSLAVCSAPDSSCTRPIPSISTPNRWRAFVALATTLFIGSTFAANNIQRTDKTDLLCSGKNDEAPVYLLRDAKGMLTRMEVSATKEGRYSAVAVEVTSDELLAECKGGMSIAVLPSMQIAARKDRLKGVPAMSSLPSSFTIMTSTYVACKYGLEPPCRRQVWGNFWVEGTMPSSHTAHIVQYDLAPTAFSSASIRTHFVNSILTVSNTSFASDFQGKGMIIGQMDDCGFGYASLAETWQNNNMSGAPPGTVGGVTWGTSSTPNTCYYMSGSNSYRFLVGANRDQFLQYWVYPNASPSPTVFGPWLPANQLFWSSQYWGTTTNAGVTNAYPAYSYSGLGASGVTFFVATLVPYVPASEQWSLSFTNVSSVTQP